MIHAVADLVVVLSEYRADANQRPSHMLAWPHSGFHVHDGVWVAADNREFAVQLARYCARNPVALSRLEYQSDDATVTYHSDKSTGPTAGSETVDAVEFLASGPEVSVGGVGWSRLACIARWLSRR